MTDDLKVTLENEVVEAERLYRESVDATNTRRQNRNDAIHNALAGGMTQAYVGRLIDLGRARIAQIVRDRKRAK